MGFQSHLFQTSDMSEGRDYILRNTGTEEFELDQSACFSSFRHRHAVIGQSSMNALQWNCFESFVVKKVEKSSNYSFHFVTQGQCEIGYGNQHFTANAGDVYVLHPAQQAKEHWIGDCEQLILRISTDELATAAAKVLGQRLEGNLQFDTLTADPGIACWLKSLPQLREDNAGETTSLFDNSRVAYHFEQSLLMMLLSSLSHSSSFNMAHSRSTPAPYYVKRVENYFREHFADDITMDDIVAVSGVSVRTIFYGFKRWRCTSPMGFLRDLRLDKAQAMLCQGASGPRAVSAAAMAVGLTNLSQFSKLYKARFGLNPSTTLVGTAD
jgi:AraC-like DNA-binding protein